MSLYTKKGDDGTTTTFACDQRLSKSSKIAETLGVMDEANSYLGVCKTIARKYNFDFEGLKLEEIIHELQDDMFTIQAELAGAEKYISEDKVKWQEGLVDKIENSLPEINSFFIPGASELSAHLDFARALVRRAERRVVAVHEEGIPKLQAPTLAYMNRASSLLYALVRLANHKENAQEYAPDYK